MSLARQDLVKMLASNLGVLKTMAEQTKNSDLLRQVEEQQKKLTEMNLEFKQLKCDGCGVSRSLRVKAYDYEVTRWFKCPHGSIYCPKCLRKSNEEAREKRKEERAQKKLKTTAGGRK